MSMDVSGLQHLPEAADLELEQLHVAEEVGRFGSFTWDLATAEVHWSPGMYRLLGLPLGSPASMEYYRQIIDVPDKDAFFARAGEQARSGESYMHEYKIKPGPGVELWVRTKARGVRLGGRPTSLGVVIDITQQMNDRLVAQQLNDQLSMALRNSQELIKLLDLERNFRTG